MKFSSTRTLFPASYKTTANQSVNGTHSSTIRSDKKEKCGFIRNIYRKIVKSRVTNTYVHGLYRTFFYIRINGNVQLYPTDVCDI
jgi:hypothetical protein